MIGQLFFNNKAGGELANEGTATTIPTMSDFLISDKGADNIVSNPWSGSTAKALQPIASFGFSQSGPWAPQQPYLLDLFGRAQSQLNQGIDPLVGQSQQMKLNLASGIGPLLAALGGQAQQTAGMGADTLGFLTNPALLTPWSNPFLAMQGNAVAGTTTDNLLRNQLPAIRSGAMDAGQYGGSRQGVAEGVAIGDTNRAIANALASLYGGAYQQGLGTMLGAASQTGPLAATTAGLGGTLAEMYGIPANLVGGVGAERTMLPWNLLQLYQQTVGGKYGEEGRTIKTDPGYKVGESMIGSFKNLMGSIGGMMGGV